jgi:hypothetical protein
VTLGLVLAGLGACAALVGVGDVPVPDDGGAISEGGPDATAPEGQASEPDAEGGTPSGPADAAPDALQDGGAPDALPDVFVDPACTATWEFYDDACNRCGQMACCQALTACEKVDDAGIDPGNKKNLSFCATYVYCVTGYQKSANPDADSLCQSMDHYSAAELALGNAALACVRTSCPQACDML